MGGQGGARVEFGRESIDLFLGGDFGGEQEPKQTFQEGFSVTFLSREGGKDSLTLRNGQSTESNALFGVEIGRLPEHALDAASSADALINRHLSNTVEVKNGEMYNVEECENDPTLPTAIPYKRYSFMLLTQHFRVPS